MYSNDWEVHRRRRFGDFRSQSFCVVTAPGERNGAFMACEQCYRLYGHLIKKGRSEVEMILQKDWINAIMKEFSVIPRYTQS